MEDQDRQLVTLIPFQLHSASHSVNLIHSFRRVIDTTHSEFKNKVKQNELVSNNTSTRLIHSWSSVHTLWNILYIRCCICERSPIRIDPIAVTNNLREISPRMICISRDENQKSRRVARKKVWFFSISRATRGCQDRSSFLHHERFRRIAFYHKNQRPL